MKGGKSGRTPRITLLRQAGMRAGWTAGTPFQAEQAAAAAETEPRQYFLPAARRPSYQGQVFTFRR